MTCKEMVHSAKDFFEKIKSEKSKIDLATSTQISNQQEKDIVNGLAAEWFSDFSKQLIAYGIESVTLKKYDEAFKKLLELSSGNNRRSSYQKQFAEIYKSFNANIIIFLQTDAVDPEENDMAFSKEVEELLKNVSNKEENEYLRESLGCWENGFLKASVVLIWCAAVDRIHKAIEQIGFDEFNKTSKQMKNQKVGRFKRFDKEYTIQSISELRTVFDSDILWVVEGMQLIDINQHTRLASCFDMRCHSGHPGEAPITKYNVLSCFSDIIEIIFVNSKFSIAEETHNN